MITRIQDHTSYTFTAIVAVAGFVVWHLIVIVTGMPRGVEWGLAIALLLIGGTFGGAQLLRPRSSAEELEGRSATPLPDVSHGTDEPLRHVVVPFRGTGWRFADLADIVVDHDTRQLLPLVGAELERALSEILDNPLVNPQVVAGDIVYIKRVHPVSLESRRLPAFLIAYSAAQRERLIRLRTLGPAEPANVAGGETVAALERLVATARARIGSGSGSFEAAAQ